MNFLLAHVLATHLQVHRPLESARAPDASTLRAAPARRDQPVRTDSQPRMAPAQEMPPPARNTDNAAPTPTARRAADSAQDTATPARGVTFRRTLGDYPLRSRGAAMLSLRSRSGKPSWGAWDGLCVCGVHCDRRPKDA
eukprot:6173167-Pleurochrysis_carterae.AAC.3